MWFLIVLISLIGLLVFLFSIPLGISYKLNTGIHPFFKLQVRWLFNLLQKTVVPRKEKIGIPEKIPGTSPKKKKTPRKITARSIPKLITRALLERLKKFIREMVSCIEINTFQADFSVGTGDPADTGILFGFLSPLLISLPNTLNFYVLLEPDFSPEPVIRGTSSGQVRLIPARLVWALLKLIFSWSVLRTIFLLLRLRWKKA